MRSRAVDIFVRDKSNDHNSGGQCVIIQKIIIKLEIEQLRNVWEKFETVPGFHIFFIEPKMDEYQ